MKVFSYSQWQYDLSQDDDVMECVTCGDETGLGYVMANTEDEVASLINTDNGQQCNSCFADLMTTANYTITPPNQYPNALKESN